MDNQLNTPWVKKTRHYTLVHIFAKYWPIFIILSPTYSVGNCNKIINKDPTSPQMCCYTTLWNVNVRKSLYTVQSLMVSVGVSKVGCTHFIFVDPGMKINGCYYREVLLSQQHIKDLPFICHFLSMGTRTVSENERAYCSGKNGDQL